MIRDAKHGSAQEFDVDVSASEYGPENNRRVLDEMSTRRVPAELPADFLSTLRSPTIACANTFDDLRVLLGVVPATGERNQKRSDINAKKDASQKRAIKSAPTKMRSKTTTSKAVAFEVYESPQNLQPLAIAERRNFATKAFNSALKCLTDAVRTRSASKLDSTSHVTNRNPNPTPLQPSSPNKQRKEKDAKTMNTLSSTDFGLIADCAILALDCLRSVGQQKQESSAARVQSLDRGALILVEKLISLGLSQKALQEAVKLFDRIYGKKCDSQHIARSADLEQGALIPVIVQCDVESFSTTECTFISSYQSQVLRLAIVFGTAVITPELLESCRLSTAGSPAAVVLRGLFAAHIDAEKAGDQLRTIAQALLKVYSIAITAKETRRSSAHLKLSLLIEALSIKSRAWKLIGHSPNLHDEYWKHIAKGLSRFEASDRTTIDGTDVCVFSAIRQASTALLDNGFNGDAPINVIHAVVDIVEKDGCYIEALNVLETHRRALTCGSQTSGMLYKWRLATLKSKSCDKGDEQLLRTLETAAVSFKNDDDLDSECIDDVLLHAARMRKAVHAILQEILQRASSENSTKIDWSTSRCCLMIFGGLTQLLTGILQNGYISMSDQRRKAAFTSFAKVFETLLEADYKKVRESLDFAAEYDCSLSECVDAANTLLRNVEMVSANPELCSFLQTLLMRTSHLYWRQYSGHFDQVLMEERVLMLLHYSCRAVSLLPLEMQRSTSYGIKLEKLAMAHSARKDMLSACGSYEEVINHYIALGGLGEAVDVALLSPSSAVWSKKGTMSCSLGRALSSYARLRLDSDSESKWMFDREDLLPIQRCVLFEAQLVAIQDRSFSSSQSANFAQSIRSVMQLCDEDRLQIYRLRLLGSLLRIAAKNAYLSEHVSRELSEQTSMLDSMPKLGKETYLQAFAISTYHLVSLQCTMRVDEFDIKRLQHHLESLSAAILSTSSASALESSVDDVTFLLNQLQGIITLGRMLDQINVMLPSLLTMKHILLLNGSKESLRLIETLSHIAILYNRQNNTTQAGEAFALAEQVFVQVPEQSTVRIKCLLFYAEYLLNLSNLAKAVEVFSQASTYFADSDSSITLPGRLRLERESLMSRAGLVASRIAVQLCNSDMAMQFARQAVKLSAHIWQAIETPRKCDDTKSGDTSDTSMHSLIKEISTMTISSEFELRQYKANGSTYWQYVDLHLSALHLMVTMSIHAGLFQDAQYYAEQQSKIAQAVGSDTQTDRAKALLGLVHAKAGLKTAVIHKMNALESTEMRVMCFEDQQSILYQSETLLEIGDLSTAEAVLQRLSHVPAQDELHNEDEKHEEKGLKKAPVRGKAKAVRPVKVAPKRVADQNLKQVAEHQTTTPSLTVAQQYVNQKSQVLRNQIHLLLGKHPEIGTGRPNANSTLPVFIENGLISAKTMLHQALTELSSDAVKCVLAETAVALPVRYRSARKSGRVSFVQGFVELSRKKPVRSGRNNVVTSKPVVTTLSFSSGEQLIIDAQKMLRHCQGNQGVFSASDIVHTVYKLSCRLGLLSSTIGAPLSLSSSELVLQSMVAKDIVQGRERATIHAERATREKVQLLTWPDIQFGGEQTSYGSTFGCSLDDLSGIPETWSILTISLSDDHQELLLSKLVGRRSPFLIRVPLSRSDMEIDDDDEFSFAEAKAEFADIVANANISAHDRRGQGDREARRTWYAEREVLDKRLQTWLCNVESLWLGGFRGLMSSVIYDDQLLAKFGQRLYLILDKHLPSRQRSGSGKSNKVALHAHVLELFLGLGDPDEQEIDDAATDLLYFVVDILQFSGEQNAYDEIDFDAILVDIFDAMRGIQNSISPAERSSHHTILVIDKEMTEFPWESLPCLKGQSVSRMPSLGSIVQRLKIIREQAEAADAYSVSTSRGAYMLNPSSDLTSTQAIFEPVLQHQLPHFAASINTKPTEFEFSSALSENQLFLYFGHGSGAQYIRGRTIRNLDACAVTLLMGCSSAKMTECGKFESYGTPGYYMNGMSNCMAVVGTLWDVTDRDIDRFAMRTLVEWGLLEEDEDVVKVLEKKSTTKRSTIRKGKERNVIAADRRGMLTLDEAVNRGRDACLLRYLNGAAPVVYGVPVLLE